MKEFKVNKENNTNNTNNVCIYMVTNEKKAQY